MHNITSTAIKKKFRNLTVSWFYYKIISIFNQVNKISILFFKQPVKIIVCAVCNNHNVLAWQPIHTDQVVIKKKSNIN